MKTILDNEEKRSLCVFWMVYLEIGIMGIFSSYCTPELRTSGRTLTLFIFIDTMSVCEERKMERKEK